MQRDKDENVIRSKYCVLECVRVINTKDFFRNSFVYFVFFNVDVRCLCVYLYAAAHHRFLNNLDLHMEMTSNNIPIYTYDIRI